MGELLELRGLSRHYPGHKALDELSLTVLEGDCRTATANGATRNLLRNEMRAWPTLYPSPETQERGEWMTTSALSVQRLRDRLWTELKSS